MTIAAWIAIDAAQTTRHLADLLTQAPCQNVLFVTPHPAAWQAWLRKHPVTPSDWTVVDARRIDAALAASPSPEAIVTVDCHELFAAPARRNFHQQLARHARTVIHSAPLGTDLQKLFYYSLAKHYRETSGHEFEPLAASLRFGLPTPDEIFTWIESDQAADLYYSGDVDDFRVQAERLLNSSRWHRFLRRLTESALSRPPRVQPELHLLETVPMRRHRRFYVHSLRK